ncbi:MAG: crotonase, partial [Azoarcus sp.]
MPMGPVELVDTVGLDIAVAAGKALAGDDAAPPQKLLALVSACKLGKKTGEGYYRWSDGKPKRGKAGAVPAGLADRILAPLLSATRRCVEEGVVDDADLADAGVIFGTGFAPWSGGPMKYQQTRGNLPTGVDSVVVDRNVPASQQDAT